MRSVFALPLVESDILAVAQHVPCKRVACGCLVDGRGGRCVGEERALTVADELHVFFAVPTSIVGAVQYDDAVDFKKLRQHIGVDRRGVRGAAGILDAFEDFGVALQAFVGLNAQRQHVRLAPTVAHHLGT